MSNREELIQNAGSSLEHMKVKNVYLQKWHETGVVH